MKYLCLIYSDEETMPGVASGEWDALVDEHLAYDDELRQSGHFVAAEALEPAAAATTLRVKSGTLSVTDGPYVETKEQLGGFFLIEARDLNAAIQVAAKIPSARFGSVEVRPVQDLLQIRRDARTRP